MAAVAVFSEARQMRIVAVVAGVATAGICRATPDRRFMARAAIHAGMRTLQCETGLPVMVELPGQPVRRIVAIVTLIAEATVMSIVAGVAGEAISVRVVKSQG